MNLQPRSHLVLFCRSLFTNTFKFKSNPARSFGLLALVLVATTGLASTVSPVISLSQLISGSGAGTGLSNASGSVMPPKALASSLLMPLSPDSTVMSIERRGHTATLLGDGRVLIVGGENGGGLIGQSEIFNPTSATFSVAGNLSSPRADHTSTKLSDGRLLIAGGRGGAGTLNTTEIFDPTTGAFAPGPAMSVARAGHSATLFADGRVFLVGGDANGSAEIVDVTSGSSASAGNMSAARSGHAAALMLDGRVLVVGGRDAGGNALSSGEIFDTPAAAFSTVDSVLKVARVRAHLRVLFDGKIQIIGGNNDGSMEIYDPAIEEFGAYAHVLPESDTCAGLPAHILASQTRAALFHNGQSDPLFDRTGHTITEMNGKALVLGGTNSGGAVLNSSSVVASSSASITTDKMDYGPGQTATIFGRGFQPGEIVRVKIHEDPHTPQERGFDVVADADGNFSGEYLVQDYDLDMKFIVGGRGLSSSQTAQTTFTDATNFQTFTVGPQTPNPVVPGNSATYLATIGYSGAGSIGCSATLSVITAGGQTGLPAGTSTSFSTNPVPGNSTSNPTSTLSIGTNAVTTPPGTYTFTVRANAPSVPGGQGCGGAIRDVATSLVVSAGNAAPTATAVSISGTAQYGQLLSGNYTYSDADSDAQGTSTFRWLRNGTTVVGTSQTYTTVSADVGQTLTFEVTPVAATGTSPGTAVQSSAVLIGKVPLAVTASSHTVTYGDPVPTVTPSYSGFVSPDGAGDIDAPPTCTTTYTTTSAAGSAQSTSCSGGSDANYSFSFTPGTVTINKADATVVVTPYSVTYDGLPHTATYTITGVNGETGATVGTVDVSNTTHTNAGTYASDSWSFTGTANYNNIAATTITDTINKANANCSSIVGYTGTYDAAAHGATGSCIGVASETLSGLNLGSSFTNVPGGTANWVFTDVTGNYNDTNGSVAIVINQAVADCSSIAGYTGTYDAAAHGATGACTGVVGDPTAAGSSLNLGASFTNVPGGTANWSFTGGTNYTNQNGSVPIVINKANATVVVTPYSVTYDANPHTATYTITGVGTDTAAAGSSIDVSGTTHTAAATYNGDAWSFSGGTNYNDQNGTVDDFIGKANATVVVTPYSVTYDANPHTATYTITGVGTDTAAAGSSIDVSGTTHTAAGTYNGDAWSFSGGTNYNDQNGTVDDFIGKANANCSSITGYSVTYDTVSHTATGTCQGVGADGTLAGLDLSGTTHTAAGSYPTDPWTFIDVSGNYHNTSGTVADLISKRNTLTTVSSSLNPSTFGESVSFTATVVGTGAGAGNPSGGFVQFKIDGNPFGAPVALAGGSATSGSTTTLSAVNHSVEAIFTSSDTNFNNSSDLLDGGQTVNKRNTLTTVSSSLNPSIFGQSVSFTATVVGTGAGAGNPSGGSVQFKIDGNPFGAPVALAGGSATSGSTTTLSVGNHIVEAIFTSSDANFNNSSDLLDGGQTVGGWTLTGFYQPVGIPNTYHVLLPPMSGITWNSIKGGQTVPLKFNVFAGTEEQTTVSAITGFTVQEVACVDVGTTVDDVDFVTTGSTQLRYDGIPGSGGQFIQNWQTPKTANKCYRTVMTTSDSSMLVAFFKTKK